MIKENQDVTIREYLEALKEIENIQPIKTTNYARSLKIAL